jgi:hypothetical protein
MGVYQAEGFEPKRICNCQFRVTSSSVIAYPPGSKPAILNPLRDPIKLANFTRQN